MKIKKILLITLISLSVLSGCTTHYKLTPINKNSTIVKKNSDFTIARDDEKEKIEIKMLNNNEMDAISDLEFMIKITNKSKKLLKFKAKNIRISFNNFWFDVNSLEIMDKSRLINYKTDENFNIPNEIMPNKEKLIKVKFKTPFSDEYYKSDSVSLEIVTSLNVTELELNLKKIN